MGGRLLGYPGLGEVALGAQTTRDRLRNGDRKGEGMIKTVN